jgi:hypothetical protein
MAKRGRKPTGRETVMVRLDATVVDAARRLARVRETTIGRLFELYAAKPIARELAKTFARGA